MSHRTNKLVNVKPEMKNKNLTVKCLVGLFLISCRTILFHIIVPAIKVGDSVKDTKAFNSDFSHMCAEHFSRLRKRFRQRGKNYNPVTI
jgi:hypothetical protein